MDREKLLLWSVFIRFILVLAIAAIYRTEKPYSNNHKTLIIKGDTNGVITRSIN